MKKQIFDKRELSANKYVFNKDKCLIEVFQLPVDPYLGMETFHARFFYNNKEWTHMLSTGESILFKILLSKDSNFDTYKGYFEQMALNTIPKQHSGIW